ADRNRSHWSTSKTPSYTKSVSWQHHPIFHGLFSEHFSLAKMMNFDGKEYYFWFSVKSFLNTM
ncbi:hypothetical protein, partial [Escherichia coli]|uniref:hypothetical protein n=1 Tax=Escherichia coli TaxID=562 RepID=UPI001F49E02A